MIKRVAFILLLAGCSGNPAQVITDKEVIQHNTITQHRGTVSGVYVPGEYDHKISVGFIPGQAGTILTLVQPGWAGTPTSCETPDYSHGLNGITRVDTCPGHYPDASLWPYWDRGFSFKGITPEQNDSESRRVAIALTWATQLNPTIDHWAGVTLTGTSMGAHRVVGLAATFEDEYWRQAVTVIENKVGVTDPTKLPTDPFAEDFDLLKLNPWWQGALGRFDGYYFNLLAGSQDDVPLGYQTDATLARVFEANRISYRFMYHGHPSGHSPEPPNGTPAQKQTFRRRYEAPGQSARLDQHVIAFSDSTANHCYDEAGNLYLAGHCNLGLSWNNAGIVDTPDSLTIPIRYKRETDLWDNLPAQPESTTVSLTIRQRLPSMTPRYQLPKFGIIHGVGYRALIAGAEYTAVASGAEVTFSGVGFNSSNEYTNVIVEAFPAAHGDFPFK